MLNKTTLKLLTKEDINWRYISKFSCFSISKIILLYCFMAFIMTGCIESFRNFDESNYNFINSFSENILPDPSPVRPIEEIQNSDIFLPPVRPDILKKDEFPKIIKVIKGDTLYRIAHRLKIDVEEIIKLNSLQSPYTLLVGQKLEIPSMVVYKIKSGDSLFKISKNFNTKINTLIKQNNLVEPYRLMVGDNLIIPKFTSNNDNSNLNRKIPVNFIWPVVGKIISNYGTKKGGIYNEGININAPEGTTVVASADGVVVYAADELKGYGKLILIRHKGGWVSAYAHNAKIFVQLGQSVNSGQRIAFVGTTGDVTVPQLYFEIRKRGSAVNPIPKLVR